MGDGPVRTARRSDVSVICAVTDGDTHDHPRQLVFAIEQGLSLQVDAFAVEHLPCDPWLQFLRRPISPHCKPCFYRFCKPVSQERKPDNGFNDGALSLDAIGPAAWRLGDR